jgi:hypothetical protein
MMSFSRCGVQAPRGILVRSTLSRRARVVFARPCERRSEVVAVRIQAFEPTSPLARNGDIRVRRLDQLEVMGKMVPAQRIGLIGLGESLLAKLA